MKLLHIITSLDKLYGAQRHVLECVKTQLQQGFECYVITGKKGTTSQMVEQLGVTVFEIPLINNSYNIFSNYRAVFAVQNKITELSPNLVIAHSSKAGLLSRLACFHVRVPNLFTVHGWSFEKGTPFIQRFFGKLSEKWLVKYSDWYHCVSQQTADYGFKHLQLPPQKVLIAPNLHSMAAITLMPPKRHNKVIMVAEMRKQKNHLLVIDAWKLLVEKKSFVPELLFIGDGKERKQIEKAIEKKGLTNYITIIGETNQVSAYYQNCDVVVLVSRYEGLPLTLIEALQHGKPVVASKVGGNETIVKDGKNGFLLSENNATSLANYIEELYQNPQLMAAMGEEGLAHYKNYFAREQLAEQMLQIIQTAAQQSRYQ
ncbi:MAG: glycosyltransferase family 4 protein [Chitinophagaceae bacterium]